MRNHSYLILLIAVTLTLGCNDDPFMVCEDVEINCTVETPLYDSIPNLLLENWRYVELGDYYIPNPYDFWVTPNEGVDFYEGGATVERVSGEEAYNGQGFAAKLITRKTKDPINSFLPIAGGALATGAFTSEINDPLSSLQFGRPFQRKIKKVSGYYMYSPVDGDSCGIYAFARKCVTITNECDETYSTYDTLSWARFSTNNRVDEYELFELNLTQLSSDTPDEIVIYFASSDAANEGKGGEGSTLYIDELSVEYE